MHLLRTLPTSNLASTTLSENGSIQSFSLMNIMDGLQGNSYIISFLEQALPRILSIKFSMRYKINILFFDSKGMAGKNHDPGHERNG